LAPALVAALALCACSLPWQAAQPAQSPTPAAAPAFSLAALDGGSHSLADYRGRTVVINFWATWCIPCRAEIPDLEHEARTQDPSSVVIVGIDWRETADPVRAFTTEIGVSYPILLDLDGAVYDRYGVDALPQTFIVDSAGRLAKSRTGIASRAQMEAEIRAVAG
jgi:peroxiredoxin